MFVKSDATLNVIINIRGQRQGTDSTHQVFLSESILKKCEAYISCTEEDDGCCQENLETVQIESIYGKLEAE